MALTIALFVFSCSHLQGNSTRTSANQNPLVLQENPEQAKAAYHFLRAQLFYLDLEGALALHELEQAARLDRHPYVLKELASAYFQAGRLDLAESVVAELLKSTPGAQSIDLLYLSAEIRERKNDFPGAIADYKEIIALDGKEENAWLSLSRLYTKSQDIDGALQALRNLLDVYPESERGHYYVGALSRRQGRLKEARLHFEKAIAQNPELVQAMRQLAEIHEQEEQFQKALEVYVRILDLRPTDEQANTRVVQIYLHRQQQNRAIDHLLQLESLVPDNLQFKLALAKIYFESEKYPEALGVFRNILQLKPDYHAVRFYQGIVLEEMDLFDEALKVLSDIPQDATVFVESSLHRAYLLQMKGDYRRSLEILRVAISIRDDIPEMHDLMASAHEALGENDAAIALLEKIIPAHASNDRLQFHLGVLYDTIGKKDACIVQMKKVIEINPEHASGLNYLGFTYAEANIHLKEAESLVRRALRIRPDDAYIHDSLGWVYFKQGNYSEALEYLKKAFRMEPEELVIAEHLADVYVSLGRKDHARTHYQKAVGIAEAEKNQAKHKDDLVRLREKLQNLDLPKAAKINNTL